MNLFGTRNTDYERKVYVNTYGDGLIISLAEFRGISSKEYAHEVLLAFIDQFYCTSDYTTYRFYDANYNINTYVPAEEVGLVFLPNSLELRDFLDELWDNSGHVLVNDPNSYIGSEYLACVSFGLANILCQYHD